MDISLLRAAAPNVTAVTPTLCGLLLRKSRKAKAKALLIPKETAMEMAMQVAIWAAVTLGLAAATMLVVVTAALLTAGMMRAAMLMVKKRPPNTD
ncbi:MAG: hypothetical protein U5N55_07965 [Cypionkella sp.]|nr:hypothetical protein [Cypionkella sp.]